MRSSHICVPHTPLNNSTHSSLGYTAAVSSSGASQVLGGVGVTHGTFPLFHAVQRGSISFHSAIWEERGKIIALLVHIHHFKRHWKEIGISQVFVMGDVLKLRSR